MVLVEGSLFSGSQLGPGQASLPLLFVVRKDVVTQRENERGRLVSAGALTYHERFEASAERTIGQRLYYELADGRLVRSDRVTRVERQSRPKGVAADARWIDVDLASQALVAYEGDEPVYATLVSTGRVRRSNNPMLNHETPTGRFRILSKHVSTTMDGDHAVFGPYSLEDVPYVQFFQGAFAMHGAFWHDKFGRPASHGCINLAPRDALWLFNWTSPEVPSTWHAAYPRGAARGTWLVIRGTTPRG
jgi:lipoprotein-anchoring transpeptidase ErfK/SrfK